MELSQTPGFRINCAVDDISDQPNPTHCPKSNQHFLDISGNVEESLILQDIFRVVSRFPRYISCYIAENRLPLGQCTLYRRNFFYVVLVVLRWRERGEGRDLGEGWMAEEGEKGWGAVGGALVPCDIFMEGVSCPFKNK